MGQKARRTLQMAAVHNNTSGKRTPLRRDNSMFSIVGANRTSELASRPITAPQRR
jgi:hypothetical protein